MTLSSADRPLCYLFCDLYVVMWLYLQVQQSVLHQNLPSLLLQQSLSIRILLQRLHQVVFGETEEVGVADAPDVRRPPVSCLTAC